MTDLAGAVFSQHALIQMQRRGITRPMVLEVLNNPEQESPVREGRIVVQGLLGNANKRLLRIFVDIDRQPPEIVTVYLTSRIAKYRSKP